MTPFMCLGGRLHGEERLMDLDKDGDPPASFIDIISSVTYYARAISVASDRDAAGNPTTLLEIVFYMAEDVRDLTQAMQALTDILTYQYFKKHGTVKEIPKVVAPSTPNGHSPGGLILPGGK